MTTIDWLLVLVINGSIIVAGLQVARGTKSSSEWFLGGRALPWWAIGLSMFATNIDNADLVSVTGNTYSEGVHLLTVYAVGSVVGGVLAAFLIVPSMYRFGMYTNAEYLEHRFGPSFRILSALIQIQYRSSMLGLIIYSIHLLLTRLVGLQSVTAWVCVVAMVVLSGIYTSWGGLKSVVLTDSLQGIVMMIGGIVIFLSVNQAVGGWEGMLASLQLNEGQAGVDLTHIGRFHGASGEISPWVVVLGWTIIGSGYWSVNHTQSMRLLGARSIWDIKMAALFGVAISLPIMIVSAQLGVYARAHIPDLATIAPDGKADWIYPHLASEFLGPGLKGIVVASIVAAAISTFDSMGSALSAIFTRDVYARLLVKDRDDAHYLFVSRVATVGVLLLGFAYLPLIYKQENMLKAFTTLIPVFVTPLFVVYILVAATKVSARSALIGLVCGSSYGLFALYCREGAKFGLPEVTVSPYLVDRYASLIWTFSITMLVACLAQLVLGKVEDFEKAASTKSWLDSSRDELKDFVEHPFQQQVPIWARPELYAVLLFLAASYLTFVVYW